MPTKYAISMLCIYIYYIYISFLRIYILYIYIYISLRLFKSFKNYQIY